MSSRKRKQTTKPPKSKGSTNSNSIKYSLIGDSLRGSRGHYVGIHTSNFRDFILKPELLRAVVDCGFEHPSEG